MSRSLFDALLRPALELHSADVATLGIFSRSQIPGRNFRKTRENRNRARRLAHWRSQVSAAIAPFARDRVMGEAPRSGDAFGCSAAESWNERKGHRGQRGPAHQRHGRHRRDVAYMSPELTRGMTDIDRQETPAKPTKYQLAIAHQFEQIAMKLLEKRLDDRYASADELLRDLERFGKVQDNALTDAPQSRRRHVIGSRFIPGLFRRTANLFQLSLEIPPNLGA
jgi:hypothetical protein